MIGPVIAILLAASAPPVPAPPDLAMAEPQIRDAIREAWQTLREQPESAAAWGRYASVLDVHAFASQAARAYEVAGTIDPQDFRWPYLLAVLRSNDDPAASLAQLRRALEVNDAYVPLQLRYAAMMEAMGRADEAIAAYRRAVALDDRNPYAHAGLGRCLLAGGDMDGARVHLERAIELDGECRPALSAMAAYTRRAGDLAATRSWSERAAAAPDSAPRDEVLAEVRKLGVSTTEIVRRANELQAAGQTDAARQVLERLVLQNPASVRGRNKLGELYLAADDTAAAAGQFRAALAVEPDFVPARLDLAHLLTRTGALDEARREYETVIAGHPSSVPAHRGLAICLAAQGSMAPAADHFARVIELAPDDDRARLACGSALLSTGQYQRAADVLAPLVNGADAPDDELAPRARAALVAALCALAEKQAAAGAFEPVAAGLARVATLLDDRPEARADLALVYDRVAGVLGQGGDWAAAIALLRRGQAVLPQSPGIINELAWLLATAPDPSVRNGAEAVELAERAVQLTGGDHCNELDTLAAAYAEAGRYKEAVATAERALRIAEQTGQAELAGQIAERLRRLKTRNRQPD